MPAMMLPLGDLLKIVRDLLFEGGIGTSLRWLLKGSPLFLRVTALTFFALSLVLGSIVLLDVTQTNRIMMDALSAPVEANPHPSNAIVALLLASVLTPSGQDDNAADTKHPRTSPQPSIPFRAELTKIENTLVKDTGSKTLLQLEIINAGKDKSPPLSEAIVSDRQTGFLFIPGTHLPSVATDNVTSFLQSDKNNPSVAKDIALAQNTASVLCGELTSNYGKQEAGVAFEGEVPNINKYYQQAYLIFRSGVARLCESSVDTNWEEQRHYYENKFSPDTDLHDRPYFEPTVRTKYSNYFYQTNPYIDLGGNSLVRTFCHYIPVQLLNGIKKSYRTDAVICFDFKLDTELAPAIRSQISRFGGTATLLKCEAEDCIIDKDGPPASQLFSSRAMGWLYPAAELSATDLADISLLYKESKKQQSTFFGDIKTLAGRKSGILRFTVPNGGNKLLAIKLDLNSYQAWRTLWLSLAAGSIAVTGLLIVLILADYGLKFKEQERAFTAVDTIMSDVPAPYARLDEEGKFLKVNDAFAKLMGYDTAAEATSELSKYKYEQFLFDEASKDLYKAIKKERRDGKPYRSYSVQLWTGRTPGRLPVKWLKVHGSDVPTPHTSRRKPGQSFGILLETDPPKMLIVMDSKEGRELINKTIREIKEAS